MKTKLNISAVVIFVLCISLPFSLFAQNKYEKTYDLSYDIDNNRGFVLDNNYYYIQHEINNGAKNLYGISSGSMKMKYKAVKKNSDSIIFEVEYADKSREFLRQDSLRTNDYKEVIGKKVRYSLSAKGAVSGFTTMTIEKSDGNKRLLGYLEEEIIHMLPTLPKDPVTIGDTWETSFGSDREDFESFSLEYTLLDEVVYKGYDCLKIIAHYKTHEDSKGTQNGKNYTVESNSTGHDLYFFAYKEGMLLSRKSIGNGTLTIHVAEDGITKNRTNNVLYETNIHL